MPNHCATNVTTKPQSRQRHGCDDVSCLIDGEASTQTMLLLHLLQGGSGLVAKHGVPKMATTVCWKIVYCEEMQWRHYTFADVWGD